METTDQFSFFTAGRLSGEGSRKNIHGVIQCFRKAFPEDQFSCEDVVLKIKLHPEDMQAHTSDPRLIITQTFCPERSLSDYMASCHAYVNASAGEGWGLMLTQMMALGRPVITPFEGGVSAFVNVNNAFRVHSNWVPAESDYYAGEWLAVDESSLIQQMRYAYEHRDEVWQRGLNAARTAAGYSWTSSNLALWSDVLRDYIK